MPNRLHRTMRAVTYACCAILNTTLRDLLSEFTEFVLHEYLQSIIILHWLCSVALFLYNTMPDMQWTRMPEY